MLQPSTGSSNSAGQVPHVDPELKKAKKVERRILIDKICKCIPIIATFNAAIDMHQKHKYLQKHEAINEKTNAYHVRIMNDKTWEQCFLLVPVLGQIVLAISSLVEACSSVKEAVSVDSERDELLKSNYPQSVFNELSDTAKNGIKDQYEYFANSLREDEDDIDHVIFVMHDLATQGYPPAQFDLGMYYSTKTDDKELAHYWLNQAVQNGHEGAIKETRNLSYESLNEDEKLNFLKTTLESGTREVVTELYLAKMVEFGNADNLQACFALGKYFAEREGNKELAKEWFREAVALGSDDAKTQLGILENEEIEILTSILENRNTESVTLESSLEKMKAFADAGNDKAQSAFGQYYRNKPDATQEELNLGEHWLIKAAFTRQNQTNQ